MIDLMVACAINLVSSHCLFFSVKTGESTVLFVLEGVLHRGAPSGGLERSAQWRRRNVLAGLFRNSESAHDLAA